jgi:hypothetical protein
MDASAAASSRRVLARGSGTSSGRSRRPGAQRATRQLSSLMATGACPAPRCCAALPPQAAGAAPHGELSESLPLPLPLPLPLLLLQSPRRRASTDVGDQSLASFSRGCRVATQRLAGWPVHASSAPAHSRLSRQSLGAISAPHTKLFQNHGSAYLQLPWQAQHSFAWEQSRELGGRARLPQQPPWLWHRCTKSLMTLSERVQAEHI